MDRSEREIYQTLKVEHQRLSRLSDAERLNVEEAATLEDIRHAFQERALSHHPRRYFGHGKDVQDLARDIFMLISEAEQRLRREATISDVAELEPDSVPPPPAPKKDKDESDNLEGALYFSQARLAAAEKKIEELMLGAVLSGRQSVELMYRAETAERRAEKLRHRAETAEKQANLVASRQKDTPPEDSDLAEQLREQIDRAVRRATEVEIEKVAAKKRTKKLQGKLQALEESKSEADSSASNEAGEAKAKIAELEEQLAAAEKPASEGAEESKSKVAALEKRLASAQKTGSADAEESQTQIDALTQQLSDRARELKASQAEVHDIGTQLSELRNAALAETAELMRKSESLEAQLETATSAPPPDHTQDEDHAELLADLRAQVIDSEERRAAAAALVSAALAFLKLSPLAFSVSADLSAALQAELSR